ncbi:MAG: ATP-binding protein [Sandaracinaceae bacterium]
MSIPDPLTAYRAILEEAGDIVLVSDWSTARFVDANPAAIQRLGYSLDELTSMTGGDLSQFPRDEHRRFSEELIERGHTHARAIPVRCRDGRLVTMDLWVQRFETDAGSFHVTVLRDPARAPPVRSEFELDVARIRQSEAFYRGVVTCTEDAVVITDMETGETVEANPAACSMFGYSTVRWQTLERSAIYTHPDTLEGVNRQLTEYGRAPRVETALRRANGESFVADTMHNVFESAGRSLIVMVARDVTERRRQRERFERAQRLAAVGEVAAGVAHEINNPAAFAMLNCRVIHEQIGTGRVGRDPEATRVVEEALADTQEGLARIASVARDLRQFWRVDEREVVELDVNDVVRNTLSRLNNELRHRARVELSLERSVPRVAMQRGKLEQVLTNLLLNAAQAIVEGHAEANLVRVETHAQEDGIVISVSDTGHGMDESTLARVFEPFFSTKPADQGAGLGLALTAEILAAHGGQIDAASNVGEGTRFDVRLPLDTGMTPRPGSTPPVLPAGKRILVIDDDPGMVRAYRRMLRNRAAVVVESGGEALALLEEDPEFDVIVCDLMMPDVDGPAVHRALAERAPHLAARMVFCTGGAFTPRMRAFVAAIDNEVLDKPLRPADLDRLFDGGGEPEAE